MPDPSSGPIDAEKVAVLVWDALSKLSLKHREVIILHYYEEMPIEEIARQTRSRKGTVKSRLHYAREQLRGLLPEELNLFG